MKITRKAVTFDDFSRVCKFFTAAVDANNGYGCLHPMQEEKREDGKGNKCGCCNCWSCPLGVEAEQEDIETPESGIDWDGLCSDGEVYEGEYLLVNCDENASEDEKEALARYERYLHRYDPEWLKTHNN